MKYDFTSVPDRAQRGSTKWDSVNGAKPDAIPLSVADMEFPTAPPIVEALQEVACHAVLGYTHATDDYLEAVQRWMARRHHYLIRKEWIVNTPGVVNALGLLIDAVTKPGEGVIILTPVYYPFDMAVLAKGRKIIYSTLLERDGYYTIDYDDLRKKAAAPKTKALLFCNPHNPVGRVWTREELQKVADICCDNDLFIIDDEIHHDLILPGYTHTVFATVDPRLEQRIAVCTAPSKTFNLAGLQGSNIIISNPTVRAKTIACGMLNLQMDLNIFAYTACQTAYNQCEDWLEELLTVIDGNAKYVEAFMAEHFPEIRVCPLEGTYLQWLDMRGLGMTHKELKQMLEGAQIYLDNGELFGEAGRGFQRINLACARTTLEKTMARFQAAVQQVRAGWEANGKPVHQTLLPGVSLQPFRYDSADGEKQEFAPPLAKPTLLVFSRYYECSLCRATLAMLRAAYPLLCARGCEIMVILQSPLDTLRAAQKSYPFPLIADPDKRLYDRYNVFEADGVVQMLAGDTLFGVVAKHVRRLLDTDFVNTIATALDGEPADEQGPRETQLSAFVLVEKNGTVAWSHYGKTITDLPTPKEILKHL